MPQSNEAIVNDALNMCSDMISNMDPGGAKAQSASPTGVRKFSKVGIIEVDNIKIAWPKSRHDRRNAPLADIVEVDEDDEEGIFIRKLKAGLLHPFHHRMWAEDQSCVMWHKYYYFFLLCGI
ncbi:MAG: hypothetical protein BYD32DRAFT_439149 [Podila humilis]|nr:MAG: hypothetical protein BYD32DRAFT_439149 [Podila humilis]